MSAVSGQARAPLLRAELRWLMNLRWFAALATAIIALVPSESLGWPARPVPILLLALSIAAYNAILRSVDRRSSGPIHWRSLQDLGTIQVYLDTASLFVLVYFTAGIHSPFLGFLIFPIVFSSLLQRRSRAYVSAACTVGGVVIILMLGAHDRADILAAIAWSCTLIVCVMITERITRGLYRRELAMRRQARRLRALSMRLQSHQDMLVQQEKMAAMGQLAAGIAHEIANPLSNMDSLLQLMQRNPASPRPEAIEHLREQIQRISRTIRQLTTFAHPGAGGFEELSVNDVVRASLDMLAFDRRLKTIRLETALANDPGVARLNAHSMEQVLTNLYRNALDALAEAKEPRLSVRTRAEDGVAIIEVSDNGSGIAPEHLARVFDPFFTTKPAGQGTGLGLSISARFVREHGGAIEVASSPGRGTTFTIRIPRGTDAAPASRLSTAGANL